MADSDHFRRLALALPEATEQETWGHPTFRVRARMFATLGADGSRATVKATRFAQEALVGSEPGTFFVPPYVGHHGWVGIVLAHADPEELAELVEEAWRMTAPKRLWRP